MPLSDVDDLEDTDFVPLALIFYIMVIIGIAWIIGRWIKLW